MPVVGSEDGVTVNAKSGGTWKSWSAFWAKHSGTWKKPLGVYVKKSNNWVKVWDEKPVLTITSKNFSVSNNGDGTYTHYYNSYFTIDTVNFDTTVSASNGVTPSPTSVTAGNSASGSATRVIVVSSPFNQGAYATITASNVSGSVSKT